MFVYYNDNYSNVPVDFETFKKSKNIAELCKNFKQLNVVNPTTENTKSTLKSVEKTIKKYVDLSYVNALKSGNPSSLAGSNGLGWSPNLFDHVLNSTAGIFKAVATVKSTDGYAAAASLSSGLHHASYDRGKAFCTINSLAIAALECPKSLILDFDAHCGGGTFSMLKKYDKPSSIKMIDISTEDFDSYQDKDRANTMLLVNNYSNDSYLDEISQTLIYLEKSLNSPRKVTDQVIFYNAGVDVYPRISAKTIKERDKLVAEFAKRLDAKVVILMAGGYGNYEIIAKMHVDTMLQFV